MAHKFEIYKDKAGEFRVRFKYNSEIIFSTEGYSSKASAKNAIESIKVWLNGILVNDAVCDATEGYIAIQSEGGAMDFRNIVLSF